MGPRSRKDRESRKLESSTKNGHMGRRDEKTGREGGDIAVLPLFLEHKVNAQFWLKSSDVKEWKAHIHPK